MPIDIKSCEQQVHLCFVCLFLVDSRSSLGESIPSMTSSQDSLAQTGLYSRQSTTFNNAESPSPSMLLQPTRTEQQKKKGIKSSLGKFFGSKKEKGLKVKDSLSSPSNYISIGFYLSGESIDTIF